MNLTHTITYPIYEYQQSLDSISDMYLPQLSDW